MQTQNNLSLPKPLITVVLRRFQVIVYLFILLVKTGFSQTSFNDRWFLLSSEMYGAYGYKYADVQWNIKNKNCNAFTFWPPFDSGLKSVIERNDMGFIMNSFGSPYHHGNSMSKEAVIDMEKSIGNFTALNGKDAYKVWWNPAPEWDQTGGNWVPAVRPDYFGLTRKQAYQRFFNYYQDTCEFSTFGKTPEERFGCKITCLEDYPCNTAAAYEMGFDMVMIERSIDELSDISTGIPFIRGLSRQYNKPWGIDISTWRTSNDMATSFDAKGKLTGGWSPAYLRRIAYVSYMSGANVVQLEATVLYDENGNLNPLGQMLKEFGDFCLNRHRNIGRTDVSTALLFDYYNGFDPKHWIWCQNNAVWYQDIPYNSGDYMINNFFKAAWPEHWLHGLCPGAPFADKDGIPVASEFHSYLSIGGDPEPYEPMCSSRWGSNFDIIYDNASINSMQQYKTIILVGDVQLTPDLKNNLKQFVINGGTLVLNSQQVSPADVEFIGVQLKGTATSNQSEWLADTSLQIESAFTYTQVVPTTATVIAEVNDSDPLITSNSVGNGKVIFTTPYYIQSNAKDALLKIGEKLIGDLVDETKKATVTGPFMVDYIVNTDSSKIIVTVINNSDNVWDGAVSFNKPSGNYTTEEWISDQTVINSIVNDKVIVQTSVPAYDLKIIVINFQLTTGINSNASSLKEDACLIVSPNPFTTRTAITIIKHNDYDEVLLSVYDIKGSKVRTLYDGKTSASLENTYYWDGTDNSGNPVSQDIYIISLQTGNNIFSQRIFYSK